MRWKGEYIGVHTFSNVGQMTMGPRGAQQKEIKVLAICVVWCRQLRRSAGVSRAQRTLIVCNVQGIYTSSSVVALMSGGSYRYVLARLLDRTLSNTD